MKREGRIWLALFPVLFAVSAFFAFVEPEQPIERNNLAIEATQTAQLDIQATADAETPPPPPEITPGELPKEIRDKIIADNAKPRFKGLKNGILFVDPTDANVSSRPGECLVPEPAPNLNFASPEEIAASPLNFRPRYLPRNFVLGFEQGQKCAGVITSLIRNYSNAATGGLIIVSQSAGPAVFPAFAPEDRLKEVIIQGQPAVVEESVFDEGNLFSYTAIYMSKGNGKLFISGSRVSRAELLRVAEGLQ